MSDDNITALKGDLGDVQRRVQLIDNAAHTLGMFEADCCGHVVTAGVWIFLDDSGAYRVGWNSETSKLPAAAILGIATMALLNWRVD